MHRSWIVLLTGVALILVATGCGDDRERRLEAGVRFARNTLERAASDPLAAAAFQNHLEGGGNAATYVLSCLPDENPVFTQYVFGKVSQPWSIVIKKGKGPRDFTIEGYAEDLTQPLVVEQIGTGIPHRL